MDLGGKGASKNRQVLGVFSLSMLSISAILNLRNIPFMASLGLESIFFYALSGLFFLMPSAFICAALASRFPIHGGIYAWVKLAFGNKAGLLAIWMEWFNNVIGFPATLSMIVATLAYAVSPELVDNRYLLFLVMMVIFWGATFLNLLHIRTSIKINIIGALCGTILPGALMILLGSFWFFSTKKAAISFNLSHFIPSIHSASWVFFVGTVSSYAGMQITAFHAHNVKSPKSTFPKAILISGVSIFILSVLTTMALAVVLPKSDLNIISGIIEGFAIFFQKFHLSFLTPLLAICIAVGAIASLSAWMLGPARAIQAAAYDGMLPKNLAKTNTHGMPVIVLLAQGMIGSILALVFLWLPSAESAFWLLIALTSQFTVLMFLMMFLSAIRLSFKSSPNDQKEYFKLSKLLIFILSIMGGGCCVIAFIVGLFPPDIKAKGINKEYYLIMMITIDFVILMMPFLLKRGWVYLAARKYHFNF